MTVACCPGSFDPVTNGHLDIIARARRQFDEVVVAVLENPSKQALFSPAERVTMLEQALDGQDVKVVSFQGLTVDLCRRVGATVIVRGLRTVSDYDFEEQMAQMNSRLGVETAFMATNPAFAFLSASLIKQVVRYGGSVEGLVPPAVATCLESKLLKGESE